MLSLGLEGFRSNFGIKMRVLYSLDLPFSFTYYKVELLELQEFLFSSDKPFELFGFLLLL